MWGGGYWECARLALEQEVLGEGWAGRGGGGRLSRWGRGGEEDVVLFDLNAVRLGCVPEDRLII